MKRIRNSISNDVIVWGSDHQNTLGLVRSLGEAGIHPFVMIVMHDNDKSFILKSKYINKGYIFSSNQKIYQNLTFCAEAPAGKIFYSTFFRLICTY